jgi:hypothetical protein
MIRIKNLLINIAYQSLKEAKCRSRKANKPSS